MSHVCADSLLKFSQYVVFVLVTRERFLLYFKGFRNINQRIFPFLARLQSSAGEIWSWSPFEVSVVLTSCRDINSSEFHGWDISVGHQLRTLIQGILQKWDIWGHFNLGGGKVWNLRQSKCPWDINFERSLRCQELWGLRKDASYGRVWCNNRAVLRCASVMCRTLCASKCDRQ